MKTSCFFLLMTMLAYACNLSTENKNMNLAEKKLNHQIAKNKTPALHYIIFNQDSTIYDFMKGMADLRRNQPIQPDSRFNAFSVTKTFTALAIVQLEEQGVIQLTDPVIKYLPDFRYGNSITVKQVLNHAAGIPNPIPLSWIHLTDEHTNFNSHAYFDPIFDQYRKTISKPDEKYAYSNLGYVILGQLIENVSGKRYEDYILDSIVTPMHIQVADLSFTIDDTNRYARGYHKRSALSSLLLGFFIDKSTYMQKAAGKWIPFVYNYVNGPSYGGLIATPYALMKYAQELLNPSGILIGERGRKLLFTENYTNSGKPTGMCLAWFKGQLKGNSYYAHAGGGGGYYCEVRLYPELKMGSVIMFNRTGMKNEKFLDKIDRYFIPQTTN